MRNENHGEELAELMSVPVHSKDFNFADYEQGGPPNIENKNKTSKNVEDFRKISLVLTGKSESQKVEKMKN